MRTIFLLNVPSTSRSYQGRRMTACISNVVLRPLMTFFVFAVTFIWADTKRQIDHQHSCITQHCV